MSIMSLNALDPIRKTGEESFVFNGESTDIKLQEFWSWSSSDILNNAMRGVLAEFIVASSLGIADSCRVEWDAYDIITNDGIKIEVKSAAYLQSWKQSHHSNIGFDIRPTCSLNSETNIYNNDQIRQADVYVFCLLSHKDKLTVNPLDLDQWDFYIIDTSILNEVYPHQKRISLNPLLKLKPIKARYSEIKKAIDIILNR